MFTNKYALIVLTLLVALLVSSCKEDELQLFGGDKYLYFQKYWKDEAFPGNAKADSTNVTFFFAKPSEPFVTAKLIVVLAGRPLMEDLKFRLQVVEEETTAQPSEYTLDEYYTFRAKPIGLGEKMIQDTISIRLNRSPRLDQLENGYRLALRIVEEREVKAGQKERNTAILRVMKNPYRPTWWDRTIEEGLLGKYSALKYRYFLENVPGSELIDEAYMKHNPDKVRKLVLDFKKWLQANPKVDEDGEPITVVV